MEPAARRPTAACYELSGDSYDNTRRLDGIHWRHVKFVEQFTEDPDRRALADDERRLQALRPGGCLEVCPTGAIIRTEFDTVVIQSDICNGCRLCIAACPFGVIDINAVSNTAQKCTLCYDRLQARDGAGLLQGLPDGLDPVRHDPGAEATGGGSGGAAARAGRDAGVPLRRGREDARRAQLVLPAGGRAGGVRPAARAEDAVPATCSRARSSRRRAPSCSRCSGSWA